MLGFFAAPSWTLAASQANIALTAHAKRCVISISPQIRFPSAGDAASKERRLRCDFEAHETVRRFNAFQPTTGNLIIPTSLDWAIELSREFVPNAFFRSKERP
jgi:hypothetical protein